VWLWAVDVSEVPVAFEGKMAGHYIYIYIYAIGGPEVPVLMMFPCVLSPLVLIPTPFSIRRPESVYIYKHWHTLLISTLKIGETCTSETSEILPTSTQRKNREQD
jgi:hypothetical protein